MADDTPFDLNAYFDERLGTPGTDKIQAVREASIAKNQELQAFRQSLAASTSSSPVGTVRTPKSWVKGLGLDVNSVEGEAVNLVASLASGASRLVGNIAALPTTMRAVVREMQATDEDLAAYNRYRTGQATEADIALLSRQVAQPSAVSAKGGMTAPVADAPSMLEMLNQAQVDRKTSRSINSTFENGQIVDQTHRNELDQALGKDFQGSWDQLKQGLTGKPNTPAAPGWDQSTANYAELTGDPSTGQWLVHKQIPGSAAGNTAQAMQFAHDNAYGSFNSQEEAQAFLDKGRATPAATSKPVDNSLSSRAGDAISGLAGLLMTAGKAVGHNPVAMTEYAVENLPQLGIGALGAAGKVGMTASNIGYAADYYNQGIEQFQKENKGQLPDKSKQGEIATWAASLALAEELGDRVGLAAGQGKSVLKSITGVGEGASNIGVSAAEEAAKTSFKKSTLNTIKAGGEGILGEGLTEGYQGYAEGKASGKEATALDIFKNAVIGAGSGGMLSTGGHVVHEATQTTPEHAAAKEMEAQQKADFQQAVANNDPSAYLDQTNKAYDPALGLGVLFAHNQKEDTSPEVKQQNFVQALDISDKLQNEYDHLETQIKEADSKTAKELTPRLKELERQIKASDTIIQQMDEHLYPAPSQEEMKSVVQDAGSIVPEASEPAIERVLNLAMTNNSALSTKDADTLASDNTNNLTTEQRDVLRSFSASREQENVLSSMGKVSQEVLYGSQKNIGIQQYQQRIGSAIASGKQDIATRQLDLLTAFAADHAGKAQAAALALSSQGLGAQIVKTDAGWEVAKQKYSDKEIRKNGGLTLNSARLVKDIQTEAKALSAAQVAMTNAVALRFPEAGVQSIPSTAAVSAKVTSAADSSTTSSAQLATPSVPEIKQGTPEKELTDQRVKDLPHSEAKAPEVVAAPPAPQEKKKATLASKAEQDAKLEAQLTAIKEKNAAKTQEQVNETVTESAGQPAVASPQAEAQAPAAPAATATQPTSQKEEAQKPFRERNLLVSDFTQRAGKADGSGSTRPLVEVPGFLAKLKADTSEVLGFLKSKAITDQQQTALKEFSQTASDWAGKITAMFKQAPQEFRYQDLTQFLTDETGQLSDNAKTAIAFGAYSWVAENISNLGVNTTEEVNAILSQDKDALLNEEAQVLRTAGTRESLIINALGRPIVQALGLTSLASAPQDLQARLVSHVGAYALHLLLEEGLISRETIKGSDFAAMRNKQVVGQETKDQKFIKPGPNVAKVDAIRTAMIGTQGILNKVFGAESGLKEPGQEKIPFTQRFAGDSKQGVPSVLAKIMAHENAQANYPRLDMYQLFTQLHPDTALALAGFETLDPAVTHKANRDSIDAKNQGLQREYQRLMDYFAALDKEAKLEEPLFFSHDVWVQQRVGIDTNVINPQTSKLHRRMVARPSWTVTIPFSAPDAMNNFKLRVAEGLGVKTDKQSNEQSLEEVGKAINQPAIKAAIKVLRKSITEGGITPEEQRILVAGVQKGGEDMHTLDALMAMAHYLEAKEAGKNEFTTQLMGEVDGVTNGPMLSHLLLGAADNVEQLFELLNRGGFYEHESGNVNYNVWRGTDGSRDLYEVTGEHIVQAIRNLGVSQKDMAAIYTFTGNLQADDKAAAKARRDIVKTPLTAMVFGSTVANAVNSMANKFITSVYGTIEKAAKEKDPEVKEALRAGIVQSLQQLGIKARSNMTVEQLMETTLSNPEVDTLKAAFTNSLGKAVEETMKQDFAAYINKRRTFNRSASLAFDLYNAVYTGLRAQRVADLVKSGDIEVNAKTGKPIHDLTNKQEEALRKEVQSILPIVHTAFSQESGELSAGLLAAKIENELSQNPLYESTVSFATPFPDGPKSVKVRPLVPVENAPGVGTLVKLIHAFDSYPAHKSVMESEVLNVHDAAGAGLGNFTLAAQNLNRNLWNGLLMYSPASQLTTTLSRVLQGIASMQEAGQLPEQSVQNLQAILAKYAAENKTKPGAVLDGMLSDMKNLAYSSDDMKLQAMEKMGSVDQYALEGGQYDVTEADRKAAKRARLALDNALSADEQSALATLSALASNKVQAPAQTEVALVDQVDPEVKPTVPNIPVAIAMQLMEKMGQDVQPAMDALVAGESLQDAMSKIAKATQSGRIVQLQERYTALQAAQNSPWGELGAPSIASHQGLVDAFNQDPVMPVKQAIKVLRDALKSSPESRSNSFNQQLLNLLEKTAPKDLTVTMVTPATPTSKVLEKGADKSRGWFVAKGDKQAVYVLSPDFKYSGLTPEVLLHELTHAALATTVEAALAEGKGPAHDLVQELESLRSLASQFVAKQGLTQFEPALSNVHEFLAWGMSNLEFQRSVLNKIEMASQTGGNKLVTAMKRFIDALTGLLFKGTSKTEQQLAQNGMAVLIANVSGLFHASAQTKSKTDLVLAQKHTDPNLHNYTTTELLEALPGTVSPGFNTQLKGLLNGIVEALHGPYGSFKESLMVNSPQTPTEIFAQALATGAAPFASKSLAAGFRINDKEAYVLEQVEATMRAALETNEGHTTSAYQELTKLYQEASVKLQGKMPADLYDFVFKIESKADGKSDYLARFAALGLAHEDTADLLNFATDVRTKRDLAGLTLYEKLHEVYDAILSWLSRQFTHTFEGQQANAKLEALVTQLVGIEAKKRIKLNQKQNETFEFLEEKVLELSKAGRDKIEAFGKSAFFKTSSSGFVKALGSTVSAMAGNRTDHIMEAINTIRDEQFRQRHGVVAGIINEIRGSRADNQTFHELLRISKHIEGTRKDIITNTAKFTLESFDQGGNYLTPEHKAALSAVVLRTDLASLLNQQGSNMEEIAKYVQDPGTLQKEIKRLEGQLAMFANFGHYFIKGAKLLGYYKATGRVAGANLMFNAGNIANLYGTPFAGRIQAGNVTKVTPVIDRLTTLYALAYVDPQHMLAAREVMAQENRRTDGGHGIEMILKLHQQLQQQSKDRLFAAGEPLRMKGYVPEIFNPYIELKAADELDGENLVKQGFVQGAEVHQDRVDPDQTVKHLYVLRDGGLQSHLTGIMSYTGRRAKGSQVTNGNTNLLSAQGIANLTTLATINQGKAKAVRAMFDQDANFDPRKVGDVHLAPVLNAVGDVVNYRYMMAEHTKDNLLERDNRFEHLLGALAGNIYDKEMAVTQNAAAVQALKDQYDAEYAEKHRSYLRVGENATDPELREIWRLLPESTKQSVRQIWGGNNMMVRTDLLDINFGYRKLSIADTFTKDAAERNATERVLYEIGNFMFGEKARLRFKQGEDIWQAFVREAKDTMVVKSGVTLMGNISSNLTELYWFGVPLKDILHHHKVAMKGALAYRKDSEALERIKLQLSTGYLPANNVKELEREQALLEDSLARNPVRELIDAGMMPTIVEDVAADDDLYSFKGRFNRKVDEFIDELNPHVVNTAKTLVIAHDTPLYKALSYGTQLSDFVARYTLYQHMTQRAKNPMAKQEALQLVSDAFINYDVPSHRLLQYANDMGFIYFSKYYLRIQKTIMHLYRENPGRALMLLTASHFFDAVPTLMDSQMVHRLGNPFSTGALKYVTTLDEMATVNSLMTPFK